MGVAHLSDDLGAQLGLAQAGDPRFQAAVLHPGWHGRVQAGGRDRVGVHVGGDAHALRARLLDGGDDCVLLGPVVLAGQLEVVDVGRRAAALGDRNRLRQRRLDAVALAAHVGRVDAAALGRFVGQRAQLRRLGVAVGRVEQRGGHAERAFLHALAHQRAHGAELGRRGLHVGLAQHVVAYRAGAHVRG